MTRSRHYLKSTEYLTRHDVYGETSHTPFEYPDTKFFRSESEHNQKAAVNLILDQLLNLDPIDKTIIIQKALKPDVTHRQIARTVNRHHSTIQHRMDKIRRKYPELYWTIIKKRKRKQ